MRQKLFLSRIHNKYYQIKLIKIFEALLNVKAQKVTSSFS